MRKPTPKRIGLLRWIRDASHDGTPCYTSFVLAPWMLLAQYYLSDEDNRVLLAAHRAGLVQFVDGREYFSLLTDEGKRLLEKYKDLYPEIPSATYGKRPQINRVDSGKATP